MKASFQRADLFVFTDFVGDLFIFCLVFLLTDAVSANLLMNTELNTPIPTNIENNYTNIVLYRKPCRAHDFTNITTYHIISGATEAILG